MSSFVKGDVIRRIDQPTNRCPKGFRTVVEDVRVWQPGNREQVQVKDITGYRMWTDMKFWERIGTSVDKPTEGNTVNDKEPYPTYYATRPRPAPTQTSAELYAAADALAAEEASIQAECERIAAEREAEQAVLIEKQRILDERIDRITADLDLAAATSGLLSAIKDLYCVKTTRQHREFAKFRKQLNPLAETYGCRIVLVGDKSTATLVLI